MYKVKIGDEYLYHPWDSTRQIADPKLDTELNKNGSFTFSVYSVKKLILKERRQ